MTFEKTKHLSMRIEPIYAYTIRAYARSVNKPVSVIVRQAIEEFFSEENTEKHPDRKDFIMAMPF